jgi:cellobiose transport system permease protein
MAAPILMRGTGRRPAGAPARRTLAERLSPYGFIAPFFALLAAFGLYPLVWTAWDSMHRIELTNLHKSSWVGFANYTYVIHDRYFWNAFRNTMTLGVLSTVPQLVMALGLAHLLNKRLRASLFWRVAVLAPYATSVAAVSIVFAQLYGRDYGAVNYLLHTLFGIGNVDFVNTKWPGQIAISSIVVWRWTGYNALIYLAAMQTIPTERYEAAAVDGAGRWRQFRDITLPGLRPTILFTIVISTIGATQLFGEPMLFQGGGPSPELGGSDRQYQTLSMYFYERGFADRHLGRAAAIAWAMFLIVVIFTVAYAYLLRRMRPDGEGGL